MTAPDPSHAAAPVLVDGMALSLAVAPGPRVVEQARLAEQLGYRRLWLYDSPALYEDVWMALALAAGATDTLGLGTAVLVPHSRHPMVTASAIATMERLAPGRCAYAFGTGASARWAFDEEPLTWRHLETYLRRLRALLAGEVVDIDGRAAQMLHHPEMAVPRPVEVPLLLSAFGPKGIGVARELADGIMAMGTPADGFAERVSMQPATVLDEGETAASPRVAEAVGPWYVVMYHSAYQSGGEAVDGLPGGAAWRASVEAERPEGERHLATWEGHVTHLVTRDAPIVEASGEGVTAMAWVGTPDELAERVRATAATGVTELMYTPAGPDLEREVRAFAEVWNRAAGSAG